MVLLIREDQDLVGNGEVQRTQYDASMMKERRRGEAVQDIQSTKYISKGDMVLLEYRGELGEPRRCICTKL